MPTAELVREQIVSPGVSPGAGLAWPGSLRRQGARAQPSPSHVFIFTVTSPLLSLAPSPSRSPSLRAANSLRCSG